MTSSATVYSSATSSPSKHITVIDVYDLAESINRDFEVLVELFGNDPFESVVKKVISALETLEALAKHNDTENCEILDLRKGIERFEHEKMQRTRDKENLEKDIIELEENYKKEIDELCKIVQKLQVENVTIREQVNTGTGNVTQSTQDLTEEQLQTLIELRKMTHIQKEQIKDLQKDLDTYCTEVENLRDNIERLIQQNKELLRKNGSLQKQGRMILLERAELMRRLQQSEENSIQLRRVLNETNRACKDMELQKQLDEQSPRFTLGELREVLQEKNVLKARVIELEEKIDQIRTSSPSVSDSNDFRDREGTSFENLSIVSSSSPAVSVVLPSQMPIKTTPKNTMPPKTNEMKKNSEECLVFGPINKEPEEKLHPWKYDRKDSGVRRFFRILNAINTSLTPRTSGTPK